ncbi:MAG: hypothetical protein ACOYWZ_02285 [Bacillota bacterium]
MLKGYSYTEIGMLAGAALGGGLAVLGFTIWNSSTTFIFALFGIALGVFTGNVMDKKTMKNN